MPDSIVERNGSVAPLRPMLDFGERGNPVPEGMLPPEAMPFENSLDIELALNFFVERVLELELQNAFFLKALKENNLCPYSICKYDVGSELDEWECSAENNGKCWMQAAKEAGK